MARERTGSLIAAVVFTGFIVSGLVPELADVEPFGRRTAAIAVAVVYLMLGAGAVALAGLQRWVAAYLPLAVGLMLIFLLGAQSAWLLVSALTVLAVLRPWPEASVVGLVTVGAMLAAGSGTDNVVVIVAVVAAAILTVALTEANAALVVVQEELATARERARIGRDLHDVLGHSLTTIVVKAGLARQLLQVGKHEQASHEVQDVERLAREAVGDVRTTVAGSRGVTLAWELLSARETLAAAGIEADFPAGCGAVEPELMTPFAHVVREGVTNVVRHSSASKVVVELEPERICLRDDGSLNQPVSEGNGLRGLRERLAAVGAVLEHGPVPGGGYQLSARRRKP